MTITLKVHTITGTYAITSAHGQQAYNAIYQSLLAEQSVWLDFSEVRIFTASFFNHAIGQLLKDWTPENLNQHLEIVNLPGYAEATLKAVLENAKRYYAEANC